MDLQAYFSSQQGTGILATANRDGHVNMAVYARPHVTEKGELAFIMRERLTHSYLQENARAAYLFQENSPGYQGVRLWLEKVREDNNPELIAKLTRRSLSPEEDREKGPKHIVYFQVNKALALIGAEEFLI